MKKKTMKKIAHAYLKNRWFAGAAEPEYVRVSTDGDCMGVVYARMPSAVREYLRRETVRRGRCWLDNPAILEVFPA